MNNPDTFYWSPSRHNLALQCEWCFARRYILGMESKSRGEYRYGKTLHGYLETKVEPSEGVMVDLLEQEGLVDYIGFKKHQELYEDVYKQLSFTDKDTPEYEIGQKGEEVYLEHPVTKEKMPIPFFGIIDRLTSYGFVDYKTGRGTWGPKKIKDTKQFTYYWMWYKQKHGVDPRAYIVNFIKPKDEKEGRVIIKDIERSEQECIDLWEEAMGLYTNLIENGNFDIECEGHFFCPTF